MKRSDAFPAKYLSKDDVPSPITAVIADVAVEDVNGDHGKERKPVMTFADSVKPLIVNNVNWETLENAYGEDSDDWRGKPVEIYVDPSVMFGGRRVGGVRVRIPAKPAPHVAQRPAAPPQAVSPLAAQHAQALDGMSRCIDLPALDKWAEWAGKIPFDDAQYQEIEALYNRQKRAIELARRPDGATSRRPAMAR